MDPEEQEREAQEAEARLAAAAEGETPPAPAGDPPAEGETPPAPAGDPPAETPPPEGEPPPPPRGSRTFEARIGELSADKRRLREENARLQAELERTRRAAPPVEGDPPAETPPAEGEVLPPQRQNFATQEEFQRAVREEAARQAALETFNNRCNAVEDAGVALGEDRWKAAKRNLALLDDEGRIPFELLSVALETDKPEQVLLTLGEDPDRAAELLRMTPTKRALEIAKMTTPPTKPAPEPTPPPRSGAPDPVEPIRGRGAPPDREAPNDQDDDATWLRKRNAQLQRDAIKRAELARSLG